MKFVFGGTLSRVPYAWIALPIVLVQLGMPFIVHWAPLFVEKAFHANLTNFGTYLIPLMVVLGLLPLVLYVASLKRLRDIGWTVWLALPLILRMFINFFAGVYESRTLLAGKPVNEAAQHVLIWLSRGIYWYDWALVLLLLFIPSRKLPMTPETAAAF